MRPDALGPQTRQFECYLLPHTAMAPSSHDEHPGPPQPVVPYVPLTRTCCWDLRRLRSLAGYRHRCAAAGGATLDRSCADGAAHRLVVPAPVHPAPTRFNETEGHVPRNGPACLRGAGPPGAAQRRTFRWNFFTWRRTTRGFRRSTSATAAPSRCACSAMTNRGLPSKAWGPLSPLAPA